MTIAHKAWVAVLLAAAALFASIAWRNSLHLSLEEIADIESVLSNASVVQAKFHGIMPTHDIHTEAVQRMIARIRSIVRNNDITMDAKVFIVNIYVTSANGRTLSISVYSDSIVINNKRLWSNAAEKMWFDILLEDRGATKRSAQEGD